MASIVSFGKTGTEGKFNFEKSAAATADKLALAEAVAVAVALAVADRTALGSVLGIVSAAIALMLAERVAFADAKTGPAVGLRRFNPSPPAIAASWPIAAASMPIAPTAGLMTGTFRFATACKLALSCAIPDGVRMLTPSNFAAAAKRICNCRFAAAFADAVAFAVREADIAGLAARKAERLACKLAFADATKLIPIRALIDIIAATAAEISARAARIGFNSSFSAAEKLGRCKFAE